MRRVRILVVSSPALSRLIEHLFRGRPEFKVVGTVGGFHNLPVHTEGQSPELIIASVKPVKTGICTAVFSLKRSSPLSKLILICPMSDLKREARKCGADVCLDQENLVLHLVPAATELSAQTRIAASRPHRARAGSATGAFSLKK
jgi:hypothetical protein